VFVAVPWSFIPETDSKHLASDFVLEKMQSNGFKEIVRSSPLSGFSEGKLELFDGIELIPSTHYNSYNSAD
jgi:hypothetical protein